MICANLNILQRIVFHIMANSLFMKEIGLFHGKIGIAIMLYKYGRTQNNSLYMEFADELIEQVCDDIHHDMPINIEHGLCGVAWGLIYLIENKFIQGDLDEILCEIDEKIMEISPLRIKDQSFKTGLAGIHMYIQLRNETSKRHNNRIFFESSFLKDMNDVLKGRNLKGSAFALFDEIDLTKEGDSASYRSMPLGLDGGCAGIVLKSVIS